MDDIDLSGIDPTRRAEARRRIAIIEEFHATGFRKTGRLRDFASRMGVSDTQFHRLASAWHASRDPAALGVSLKRSMDWAGRSLPAATRAAIEQAIAALGVEARFIDVEREARRRCAATGAPLPATGSVHQQLIRAREESTHRDGPPELLVGWTSLQLPVANASRTCRAPDLLLAVRVPERAIVAHRFVVDGDLASAGAELVCEVVSMGTAARIIVDKRLVAASPRLNQEGNGDFAVSSTSSILSTWFGNRVGNLRILHRRLRPTSTFSAPDPLTPEEAEAEVVQAVDLNNRRAGKAAN